MAWNGSDGIRVTRTDKKKKTHPKVLYVFGGMLLLVSFFAIAIFCLTRFDTDEGNDEQIHICEAIQEEPQIEDSIPSETNETTEIEQPHLDYEAIAAMGKVVITNKNGREVVMTPRKKRPKPKYAIFNHSSENRIACLMSAEPGTRFFVSTPYSQRFVDDFMKSCEEPIVINAEDDDYTRRLKQDMIDMKIELRQRMRDGEDLCQIMTDAREELQRLGQLKYQIERAMKENVRQTAENENDIDLIISAANVMLEEKGIAPIKMNPILKRSLMRSAGLSVDPLTEDDIPQD